MWMFSSTWVWAPVYITLLFILIKEKQKESILIIASLILIVILCDQTTSSIMKPLFGRLRPSHDPSIMNSLTYVDLYKGGRLGFPSSHAANMFGVATFIALLFKKRAITITMLIWAISTGYSRIYLGVHFPGDVLVGSFIGALFGYLIYKAYLRIRMMNKISKWKCNQQISITSAKMLMISYYSILFSIMIFASQYRLFE